MSTEVTVERSPQRSPRFTAGVAGVFYLVNFVTSTGASILRPADVYGEIANLIAIACYAVVTVLFYRIFKPVSRSLTLLAAFFGLVDCTYWALTLLHLISFRLDGLVFLGIYLALVGYLIFRSPFLPRTLGALVAFGGLGLLTFLSPSLASALSPFNWLPAFVGEGSLTLWLLVVGVNAQRWRERATSPPGP